MVAQSLVYNNVLSIIFDNCYGFPSGEIHSNYQKQQTFLQNKENPLVPQTH